MSYLLLFLALYLVQGALGLVFALALTDPTPANTTTPEARCRRDCSCQRCATLDHMVFGG
jgi:hypothetical protein